MKAECSDEILAHDLSTISIGLHLPSKNSTRKGMDATRDHETITDEDLYELHFWPVQFALIGHAGLIVSYSFSALFLWVVKDFAVCTKFAIAMEIDPPVANIGSRINTLVAGSKLAGNLFRKLKGAQAWDIRDRVIHTERSHLDRRHEDWTNKTVCVKC